MSIKEIQSLLYTHYYATKITAKQLAEEQGLPLWKTKLALALLSSKYRWKNRIQRFKDFMRKIKIKSILGFIGWIVIVFYVCGAIDTWKTKNITQAMESMTQVELNLIEICEQSDHLCKITIKQINKIVDKI